MSRGSRENPVCMDGCPWVPASAGVAMAWAPLCNVCMKQFLPLFLSCSTSSSLTALESLLPCVSPKGGLEKMELLLQQIQSWQRQHQVSIYWLGLFFFLGKNPLLLMLLAKISTTLCKYSWLIYSFTMYYIFCIFRSFKWK